jgi:energy-coupling factor transporter transmembrane protein EcfT
VVAAPRPGGRLTERAGRWGLWALGNLAGVAAFAWLLLQPAWGGAGGGVPGTGLVAPVALALLIGFCFAALVVELAGAGLGARAVAVLGVLVALNSALRFVEVALPGPGGFTPIFVLIVLAGYAYGARLGFLTGALTLAVSAVITGGVGPWLPFQMYAAGWVGLSAGWLPGHGAAGGPASRRLVWGLALFGAAWAFGYGALMTIWSWAFIDAGGPAAAGSPLARYLAYYVLSALAWDVFGAAGTLALLALAGGPLLLALRRAGLRFAYTILDEPVAGHAAPAGLAAADPLPDPDDDSAGPQMAGAPVDLPLTLRRAGALHARAWLGWALGVAALASLTRNPLLLAGLALAVAVVRAALPREPADGPALPVGRLAVWMVVVAALYNGLMSHAGDAVLLRLPAGWPLVGGALTLEAVAYGALTGAALALLLLTFATLRRALSARDLVRLVPRAFGDLGLVATVALGYAPAAVERLEALRRAQALRGAETRGLRGWGRLAVPLVAGSLERSLDLAESLAARGLATGGPGPTGRDRAGLLGGVGIVLAGWLGPALGALRGPVGLALVAAGLGLIGATLVRLGRRAPCTELVPHPWRAVDSLVLAGAWSPVLAALMLPGGRAVLAWSPYPSLAPPPPLPLLLGILVLGLALPAAAMGPPVRRPRPTGAQA